MAPTSQIRTSLLWTLLASLIASAWALWWPKSVEVAAPVAVVDGALRPRQTSSVTEGDARLLHEARADPFFPRPASAVVPDAPVGGASSPQTTPLQAQVSIPPSMLPRIAGSFTGPDGENTVFLAEGSQLLPAKPGQMLGSGYQVEAIGQGELRLQHPAASESVVLPMPAASAPSTQLGSTGQPTAASSGQNER